MFCPFLWTKRCEK